MGLTLDHIVIAVGDLAVAEANHTRLYGRKPSWRGKHPAYGTANVLYRLDNCYMELLALGELADPSDAEGRGGRDPRPTTHDPRPAEGWARARRTHLERHGEGLYAVALGTNDIDATVAAARAASLDVQGPADGDGVDTLTGARREWRNARIDPKGTRGVRALFIEHRSPPGALPVSEPLAGVPGLVTGVDHTVVTSSDLDASLALWRDALGLDLRRTVDWPPRPEPGRRAERRLHFLRLGDSILELAGAGPAKDDGRTSDERPAASDQLWGVSYRVDNVAAQVERLRSAGVDVSDARDGRADGTIVADLKPGFSHDMRTLFIEREVVP